MGSYRKHAVGKGARKAHKKREQRAKRNAKKKGKRLLDPFGYRDIRGKSKAALTPNRHD